MWLFSRYGFFSAVAEPRETGRVMVRARSKGHLVALKKRFPVLGPLRIYTTPQRDYKYRLLVCRAIWSDIVAAVALEVTYSNFKDEARRTRSFDSAYIEALHDVWTVMYRSQYAGR